MKAEPLSVIYEKIVPLAEKRESKTRKKTSIFLEKVVDEFLKDGIIMFVLKYTHSCICTNTAGGEVR